VYEQEEHFEKDQRGNFDWFRVQGSRGQEGHGDREQGGGREGDVEQEEGHDGEEDNGGPQQVLSWNMPYGTHSHSSRVGENVQGRDGRRQKEREGEEKKEKEEKALLGDGEGEGIGVNEWGERGRES
jgi:hypothetical protein